MSNEPKRSNPVDNLCCFSMLINVFYPFYYATGHMLILPGREKNKNIYN